MEKIQYDIPQKLLNSSEVARILGTSKSFAYAIMRRGEIPVVRLGRSVRVRPQDLQNYIESSLDLGINVKAPWE